MTKLSRHLFSLRTFSAGFVLIFLAQNVLLVHATETNLWSERRKAAQSRQNSETAAVPSSDPKQLLASLPQIMGGVPPTVVPFSAIKNPLTINATAIVPEWIQEAITPSSVVNEVHLQKNFKAKTIFLMQDAHLHAEAQSHIENTVSALGHALKIRNGELLIGLEGASAGAIDLSAYNKESDRENLQKIADALMRAHILNGVEAAAIGYQGEGNQQPVTPPFQVVGIESWSDYQENVAALRAAAPLKSGAKIALEDFQRTLNELKQKYFSPALLTYDAKLTAYDEGKLPLAEYGLYLDSVGAAAGPNVRSLVEAAHMEATLHFDQVEQQRNRILSSLLKKLTEAEMKGLIQYSFAFRANVVSAAAYYDSLKSLAAHHGERLSEYPEMDRYVQYILKTESIDQARLFGEITTLEKGIEKKLIRTPEQETIASLGRDAHLLAKLSDHALIENEWHDYESRKNEIGKIQERLASVGATMPSTMKHFDAQRPTFENFYHFAMNRSASMADHFSTAFEASHDRFGFLLAGGFHTQGLVQNLMSRGFNVVVLSPKITKIEDGPSSVEVLASRQLPLNQLFVGERLFVPTPVMTALPSTSNLLMKLIKALLIFKKKGPNSEISTKSFVVSNHPGEPTTDDQGAGKLALSIDGETLVVSRPSSLGDQGKSLLREQIFFVLTHSPYFIFPFLIPHIDLDWLFAGFFVTIIIISITLMLDFERPFLDIHNFLINSRGDLFVNEEKIQSYKNYLSERYRAFWFISFFVTWGLFLTSLTILGWSSFQAHIFLITTTTFLMGQAAGFAAHGANNIWFRWNREEGPERSLGAMAAPASNKKSSAFILTEEAYNQIDWARAARELNPELTVAEKAFIVGFVQIKEDLIKFSGSLAEASLNPNEVVKLAGKYTTADLMKFLEIKKFNWSFYSAVCGFIGHMLSNEIDARSGRLFERSEFSVIQTLDRRERMNQFAFIKAAIDRDMQSQITQKFSESDIHFGYRRAMQILSPSVENETLLEQDWANEPVQALSKAASRLREVRKRIESASSDEDLREKINIDLEKINSALYRKLLDMGIIEFHDQTTYVNSNWAYDREKEHPNNQPFSDIEPAIRFALKVYQQWTLLTVQRVVQYQSIWREFQLRLGRHRSQQETAVAVIAATKILIQKDPSLEILARDWFGIYLHLLADSDLNIQKTGQQCFALILEHLSTDPVSKDLLRDKFFPFYAKVLDSNHDNVRKMAANYKKQIIKALDAVDSSGSLKKEFENSIAPVLDKHSAFKQFLRRFGLASGKKIADDIRVTSSKWVSSSAIKASSEKIEDLLSNLADLNSLSLSNTSADLEAQWQELIGKFEHPLQSAYGNYYFKGFLLLLFAVISFWGHHANPDSVVLAFGPVFGLFFFDFGSLSFVPSRKSKQTSELDSLVPIKKALQERFPEGGNRTVLLNYGPSTNETSADSLLVRLNKLITTPGISLAKGGIQDQEFILEAGNLNIIEESATPQSIHQLILALRSKSQGPITLPTLMSSSDFRLLLENTPDRDREQKKSALAVLSMMDKGDVIVLGLPAELASKATGGIVDASTIQFLLSEISKNSTTINGVSILSSRPLTINGLNGAQALAGLIVRVLISVDIPVKLDEQISTEQMVFIQA